MLLAVIDNTKPENLKKNKQPSVLVPFLILLAVCIQDISAQTLEINGFYGYQMHGTSILYDGDFRIDDAPNYGGKVSVGVTSTTHVELSFMRSDTDGRYVSFTGTPSELVSFSSNYFQVGGLQEVNSGRIRPYGTVTVGLVIWAPTTTHVGSQAQFSATVGGGLKIWLSEMVGIRLQGSMMMPVVLNGSGFGCGIGTSWTNCVTNVYTRITPLQGEFSAGLILRYSQY